MYQFKAMRTPTNKLPVGSPEWCEGMSLRFQYTYENLQTMGVDRLVEVLRELVEHKPWEKFPVDKPVKRADAYCPLVTDVSWDAIVSHIKDKDKKLAAQLLTYCNPGKTGRPSESSDN